MEVIKLSQKSVADENQENIKLIKLRMAEKERAIEYGKYCF